jgi:hypothetical protein
MRILNLACVGVVIAAAATACGGGHKATTVTIPPRLSLIEYGRVAALVTFTPENAKGSLHELATRRFSEKVLSASRGVEMMELGDADPLLKQSGERVFGPASAKVVGATRDVPVVFAGLLKVSNVKPTGGLSGFGIPHLEATVSVELTVALYSTRTGGTLWRAGSSASEKVGQLSMSGSVPSFSAKDPGAAYGRLVDRLVAVVTQDLYPTYERR